MKSIKMWFGVRMVFAWCSHGVRMVFARCSQKMNLIATDYGYEGFEKLHYL